MSIIIWSWATIIDFHLVLLEWFKWFQSPTESIIKMKRHRDFRDKELLYSL